MPPKWVVDPQIASRAARPAGPAARSTAYAGRHGGRAGRTVASVPGNGCRRGTSGLYRAGWWVTPTRGDPRDSATENRPPAPTRVGTGKGETVR
jgi:hypothetical protein